MIHLTDIYTLKARLNNLKTRLYSEPRSQQEKDLADKYLNEVLFLVEQVLR
jgi:hypothetical protein